MKKLLALLLTAMLCMNYVYADSNTSDYNITINAASRTLKLYKGEALMKEYPVAVGKASTKTPLGSFQIRNKLINPYWKGVAPGPRNPLGIRWMGISAPRGSYGIHGNNAPSSISTFASGGCIRMFNNDVEELFSIVPVGTSVRIVYENIELKQDPYTNTPVLLIYPNSYKQKNTEALLERLAAGNSGVTAEQAQKALKLSKENLKTTAAASASGTPLLFNNQFVTNDAFMEKDEAYVYYLAAMDYFGLDAETITSLQIKTQEKSSRIYINMTDAASKIGGSLSYDKATGNIYVTGSILKVNGRFLTGYTGGFDKGYPYSQPILQAIQMENIPASTAVSYVNLKDYTKQKNWSFQSDSLYKIISIEIPMKVKAGDKYLDTASYHGKNYIKLEDAAVIPGIEGLQLNLFEFDKEKYIDLEQLIKSYEYKTDGYLTLLEILRPMDAGAEILTGPDANANPNTNSQETTVPDADTNMDNTGE